MDDGREGRRCTVVKKKGGDRGGIQRGRQAVKGQVAGRPYSERVRDRIRDEAGVARTPADSGPVSKEATMLLCRTQEHTP